MNDVVIRKLSGGLGRRNPSEDMVSGLLTNGEAVSGGVQLNETYRLKSVQDALALGLDAKYDEDKQIVVFEHINEFFRINPDGDLHLMMVDKTTSFKDMVDKTKPNAKNLLIEAEGKIRQLAVAYNPSSAVTDDEDLLAAIPKAQELATEEYTLHRPVEIILEGKGVKVSTASNLRELNAPNVSVMVGQALSVSDEDAKYAAVGTLLGAISKAHVNENISWVEKFNVMGGSLMSIGIEDTKMTDISEGDISTLNERGYIFFRKHIGKAGIYFNDSHTCTELTDDYAYIENNRTIHKAVREIRTALLPRLASPIMLDPDTGQLSPAVCKAIETSGRKALEIMLSNEEVSGLDVYVDPNQNILATSELQVRFSVVPTGTARQLDVTIGFDNPF